MRLTLHLPTRASPPAGPAPRSSGHLPSPLSVRVLVWNGSHSARLPLPECEVFVGCSSVPRADALGAFLSCDPEAGMCPLWLHPGEPPVPASLAWAPTAGLIFWALLVLIMWQRQPTWAGVGGLAVAASRWPDPPQVSLGSQMAARGPRPHPQRGPGSQQRNVARSFASWSRASPTPRSTDGDKTR